MSTELAAGSIVSGKYTILSVLGRTPWATTYRALAEPSRGLVLKAWTFDPAIEAELRRRHDVLLAMPDHGLLPPVELGADEEKAIGWIASTVATTPSLAELVELCPLSPEETAAFLRSLARALAAGPPHLALKPTNVFVGPAPKYAVHLGDYEASIVRKRGAEVLPWDAPERGGDARSDVFVAALLAFFAMTRASYWEDTDPAAVAKAIGKARVAASVRARALGVGIPPSLDAVFTRALASAPGARFSKVSDLANAFAKALGVQLPASEPMLVAAAPVIETAPPAPVIQTAPPAPVIQTAPPAPAPAMAQPLFEAPAAAIEEPPPPPAIDLPLEAPQTAELAADSNVAVVAAIQSMPMATARDASSVPDLAAFTPKRRPPLLYAGIGGVALLGIVGIAALAFGGKKERLDLTDAATVAAPPSSAVVEKTVATPPPPPPSASAEPEPTPLAAGESELVIQCEPACDRIAVDGKFVADPSMSTVKVRPGSHGVGVARTGYVGDWKRVEAVSGERTPVQFTLTPVAEGVVAPRPAAPAPAPKKPCGKFLKRCD